MVLVQICGVGTNLQSEKIILFFLNKAIITYTMERDVVFLINDYEITSVDKFAKRKVVTL